MAHLGFCDAQHEHLRTPALFDGGAAPDSHMSHDVVRALGLCDAMCIDEKTHNNTAQRGATFRSRGSVKLRMRLPNGICVVARFLVADMSTECMMGMENMLSMGPLLDTQAGAMTIAS